MATTTNILALLKFFASKQKSGVVDQNEFCTYLRKYSEHHLEEQPSLSVYLEDTQGVLKTELEKLVEAKQVVITEAPGTKTVIIVVPYFIDYYTGKYNDIEKTPSLPFPTIADLPKGTPKSIVTVRDGKELIEKLLSKQDLNDKTLYGLQLPNDEPAILLPSTISVRDLVENSLGKIQYMLKKEGYHDYFLKKLTATNPGKELASKNFFNRFVDKPDHGIETLSESSDDYYLWHQLCYFIKQDYKKVKVDYTLEDMSTIQAILITEIAADFYKVKNMDKIRKENALKTLEQLINKPPYYFSYESITKFTDSQDHLLIGQYTEEDLKEWLHEKTTGGDARELPEILIFKMDDERKYFICKSKVLQLVIRLCTDTRDMVRQAIIEHWYKILKNYGSLPEMHESNAFETRLQLEVKEQSPVLHALLSASFLPLLTYEKFGDDDEGKVTLFVNGALIPYSELLLTSRQDLLSDAKIKLPFWYTMPVISWIAKLLFQPSKKQRDKKPKTEAQKYHDKEKENSIEEMEMNSMISKNSNLSKKFQLKEAAREAEKHFVTESSTIDRELDTYEQIWNKKIGQSRQNLHEDVNVLIRDYMRTVLRTLPASSFTLERIRGLSSTLVKTPSLMKIGEQDALERYIQLYIIKLVKNLPTFKQVGEP
nr:hypothetical protein [Treponema sp.]